MHMQEETNKVIYVEGCNCSGKDYFINKLQDSLNYVGTDSVCFYYPIFTNEADSNKYHPESKQSLNQNSLGYLTSYEARLSREITARYIDDAVVIFNRCFLSTLIYQEHLIKNQDIETLVLTDDKNIACNTYYDLVPQDFLKNIALYYIAPNKTTWLANIKSRDVLPPHKIKYTEDRLERIYYLYDELFNTPELFFIRRGCYNFAWVVEFIQHSCKIINIQDEPVLDYDTFNKFLDIGISNIFKND